MGVESKLKDVSEILIFTDDEIINIEIEYNLLDKKIEALRKTGSDWSKWLNVH